MERRKKIKKSQKKLPLMGDVTSSIHYIETRCACMLSHFSPVQLFVTPWTATFQAPLNMGFYRREYWRGFPIQGLNPHLSLFLFFVWQSLYYFFFSFIFIIWRLILYSIVVVLPYIDMNQPWIYMCSPS